MHMDTKENKSGSGVACLMWDGVDLSGVKIIQLTPSMPLSDYLAAMKLADIEAQKQQGDVMLISWYDRDRDFESPQHSSECHLDSAIPGYVDYGLSHGAKLMIDIENGRFVFFYMPVSF